MTNTHDNQPQYVTFASHTVCHHLRPKVPNQIFPVTYCGQTLNFAYDDASRHPLLKQELPDGYTLCKTCEKRRQR